MSIKNTKNKGFYFIYIIVMFWDIFATNMNGILVVMPAGWIYQQVYYKDRSCMLKI